MSNGLNTDLYPDVTEAGDLARAIEKLALLNKIDLGEVTLPYSSYAPARISAGRGRIGVDLRRDTRLYQIAIAGDSHNWASGETDQLLEVVKVAEAWRRGATLRELNAQFPFMTYTPMAQAYEDGTHVPFQWDRLLNDPDLDRIRPLMRAARAHPQLRELFPTVSHLTLLRLERDPADQSAGQIHIVLTRNGDYRVDYNGEDEQNFPTIDSAIQAAASIAGPVT
ncbi:DUF6193 family natural product biosynthesis protein [Catellatospora sichuanensis]|uniref:DUF6193 family natural product biosynthesis protein n=1 Tax=Catellatospora sichuanensis TaxID=1969805 RepID=UPI00118228AE|nr:DUF6193 family natural product biosynthesis protein [Catellatospora sichuanensis]